MARRSNIPFRQLVAIPLRVQFRGLNKLYRPGDSPEWTSSLEGVELRYGRVWGQKGIAKWNSFSTAETDTPILDLFPYVERDLDTTMLRMTPLKVKKWNGTTWEDITGTALTGTSSTIPQWTTIQNTVIFTNQGEDKPRKWAGSGNTATIGGTPPYCKAVCGYKGWLFLGNISTDGTFTDITDGYRQVEFSDTWDTDWTSCDANTMTIDDTPGEIVTMGQSGDYLLIGKNDGIVAFRLVGGATRFAKERVLFDPEATPRGIIAPRSFKPIGGGGYIFLSSDLRLYAVKGLQIQPIPENITSILQDTLTASNAGKAIGLVDIYRGIYHLIYNRTGGTWNDGRISYNYLTGEFYHRAYGGHAFTCASPAKLSATTDPVMLASTTTLTYQLDTGTDDDGTAVTRYYDLDWTNLGVSGEKYLMGCDFVMSRKAAVRVSVSAARDFDSNFHQAQALSAYGREVDTGFTIMSYRLPSPLYGTHFKLRFTFSHDAATNVAEVWNLAPVILPGGQSARELSALNAYPVLA